MTIPFLGELIKSSTSIRTDELHSVEPDQTTANVCINVYTVCHPSIIFRQLVNWNRSLTTVMIRNLGLQTYWINTVFVAICYHLKAWLCLQLLLYLRNTSFWCCCCCFQTSPSSFKWAWVGSLWIFVLFHYLYALIPVWGLVVQRIKVSRLINNIFSIK